MVKICSSCEIPLPLEMFYKRHTVCGFDSRCVDCLKELRRKRYVSKKTSPGFKQQLVEYNRTPKGRFHKGRFSAKKRGYLWELTFEEYQRLIARPCHYCCRPLDIAGTGLDRKDNGSLYSVKTCVPCCGRCNSTFMDLYSYQEKLLLAEAIKAIDSKRSLPPSAQEQ